MEKFEKKLTVLNRTETTGKYSSIYVYAFKGAGNNYYFWRTSCKYDVSVGEKVLVIGRVVGEEKTEKINVYDLGYCKIN